MQMELSEPLASSPRYVDYGVQGRPYGSLELLRGKWRLDADPHVMGIARSMIKRAPSSGPIALSDTAVNCVDLVWLMYRFPMAMPESDRQYIFSRANGHSDDIQEVERLIEGLVEPPEYAAMLKPARHYQRIAAEMLVRKTQLLLGDATGLGKTITGIATATCVDVRPSVVVVLPSLRQQWVDMFAEFAPSLDVRMIATSIVSPVVKNGKAPDVVVVSYNLLSDWVRTLSGFANSVIYDEVHELRRDESQKYKAAMQLSKSVGYRLGLSATPVINYGGEIFNIMNVIAPGALGSKEEFNREWCGYEASSNKWIVKDPAALGSSLRRQQLYLRRERKDVGRELPEVIRIHRDVDSDQAAFSKAIESKDAKELARAIMKQSASEVSRSSFTSLGQFDTLLRQATGIAKAPYTAEFVRLLLESGERVVLFGWHRAVYAIWLEKLKEFRPAMFTGSESAPTKQREFKRFMSGDTDLFIVSLRSGVGLDGLQYSGCKMAVFGELDWSPAIMDQCIERVNRDGQPETVTAFFLTSLSGVDPYMSEALGLKSSQQYGIVTGRRSEVSLSSGVENRSDILRQYAKKLLRGRP